MKISLLLLLPVAFAMPRWCRNTGCRTAATRGGPGPKLHRGQADKALKMKTQRKYHPQGLWTHRKYFLEQRAAALTQINNQVEAYLKFLDSN